MIISIYTEKVFDKIQHPFVIKTLRRIVLEGNFLKLIKDICGKALQLTSYLMVKTEYFPSNLGNKVKMSTTTSMQHFIGSFIWYNKARKSIQVGKEHVFYFQMTLFLHKSY